MSADSLNTLKLRSFITAFRSESAALWFLCFYIFIEYIRPQGMYPALDFLPWGQLSLLCAVISVFATRSRAKAIGLLDVMFILISMLVLLSAIFAWNPSFSFKYWSTYTSWVLMYFCIVSVLTSPNRMFLFILFFLIINLKLSEHGARSFAMRGFSFTHWGLTGPPGWFHNSGEFAMQMVVVFSISWSVILASKKYIESTIRWWFLLFLLPGTAALSVIGSSSRGGQIALMTVIFILFLKGKFFIRKALAIVAIIFIGSHFLPAEQVERFHSMGEDQTSQLRFKHWDNALETLDNHPLGIGYKNWRYYYYTNFDVYKVEEIHNTVLQAFVELGYLGGILFLLMLITAFTMNARTRREMNNLNRADAEAIASIARGINLGLLGTFIAALFMSVLYYPIFWLAFALSSALRHISKNMVTEFTGSLRHPSLSKSNKISLPSEKKLKNKYYGKNKYYPG